MALPGDVIDREVINGIPLYLNEAKMALNFLVEKFGFVVHRYPVSKSLDGVSVCDSYGNFYKIFSVTRENVNNKKDVQRIINTTDCLRDFYNMATNGLNVLNKPHYVPEGLIFEAVDPWGNRYTFLEKRDYTE
jgi:hypothetical protein